MAGPGTVCACSCTGGNSVRNVANLFVIFGLIVLAAYSSLSDASQHGTMLWASTYKSVQKILTKCLVAITSLIRQ